MNILNIRNIGIIAHVDAGKTTTTERILFYSGISHKIGEVHQGNTVTDWMKQEQERGITITSASVTVFWKTKIFNSQINIIDTPGHVDFTIEVERSLRVLDGVIIIVCASSGIQSQTETVWNQSTKFKIPKIVFVNKIDRIGSNYNKVIENLKKKFKLNFLILNLNLGEESNFNGIIDLIKMKYYKNNIEILEDIPKEYIKISKKLREELLEKISENDDLFFEKYINNNFSEKDIILTIRKLVIAKNFVPILCGSSLKNKGIETLLDSIVDLLPSPLDILEKKEINKNIFFSALLFKIQNDILGTLHFTRIYSGIITPGSTIFNTTKKKKEKVFRILRMFANNKKDLPSASSGDIVALIGLKESVTGDTLCSINNNFVLEEIKIPLPVISLSIEPIYKSDQEKLLLVLNKLSKEDPSFNFKLNNSTNELIISGMGELHLEIINDRINDEFNIKTKISKPQVYYKESIKKIVIQEGKYIKQTGGRGQYGHVVLKLEPIDDEKFDLLYKNEIIGGSIPKEYFSCIEKAVFEQLKHGILTQNSLTKVKITLLNGSFHTVDSSEYAFKNAVFIAIKEGLRKANPYVLEPIMNVEINLTNEYLGVVVSDINKKRGQIITIEDCQNFKIIKSLLPLSELFGYSTELRSITKGKANYNMEFCKYLEIPNYIFNNNKKK